MSASDVTLPRDRGAAGNPATSERECELAQRPTCQGIDPIGSPAVVLACQREVEPSSCVAAMSAEMARERE
jgi:hypothetical protein